jgi:hypothetical protein
LDAGVTLVQHALAFKVSVGFHFQVKPLFVSAHCTVRLQLVVGAIASMPNT